MKYFARPRQNLWAHLRGVASRSVRFAAAAKPRDPLFEAQAEWAGWLHDLGKYRVEFQEYLGGMRPGGRDTQHAVFGAAWARNHLSRAIASAINGHHAGLHDLQDLQERLASAELSPGIESARLIEILDGELADFGVSLPPRIAGRISGKRRRGSIADPGEELMVRMLFSCLIDADRLDCEAFVEGRDRAPNPLEAGKLLAKVAARVEQLSANGDRSPLVKVRREIYNGCVQAAEGPAGFFSLTTPTGGGKTLAGMAFALRHAERNDLRRIIVVLPFLSIIEQNARIYREVLGAEVVLEHHSAIEREGEILESSMEDLGDEVESSERSMSKLATENWDAPVVVTTAVQFFESLFARRPSRCRKLHNIARSVVILDEVQTLPHHLLEPILSVVRGLRDDYGTSFLFCSATQPRPRKARELPSGFEPGDCRELAPDPSRIFGTLQRVRYEFPFLRDAWDMSELVDRVAGHRRVLVVLNLRRQAAGLFQMLRARGVAGLFHLSSTMCAAHRSEALGTKDDPKPGSIYHALERGDPCIVVSTQVVEAGVDIDFPVVYRHLGPLDAIIQAAGRCNREGKIPADDQGRPGGLVVVFELAGGRNSPPGFYAESTRMTRERLIDLGEDPSRLARDPDLFGEYHEALVAWNTTDGEAIQDQRKQLNFEEVSRRFRMIEQDGQAVIVEHRSAKEHLDEIRRKRHYTSDDLRRLQRFAVTLYPADIEGLGDLVSPLFGEADSALVFTGAYDDRLGIPLGELPPDAFAI